MTPETLPVDSDDTRERLIAAATRQFAERGFYGASIAQIASEVGLTKQALLYHFKRKDELYSEVLRRIAERLQGAMAAREKTAHSPEQKFEDVLMGFYEVAQENPLDSRMLMRELLDNQRRDAPESEWHLRETLNRIVATLDQIPAMAQLSFAQKFARIYTAVSAVEYFTGSQAALGRFYGEDGLAEITAAYPEALRRQLRAIVRYDQ